MLYNQMLQYGLIILTFIGLHLGFDDDGKLYTWLYDMCDDFWFPYSQFSLSKY